MQGAARLFHVCKTFPPDRRALDDLSLSVAPGAFVVLSGPSGAGKTTLLRLLYGAEAPGAGKVLVNGRNVSQLTRRARAAFRREIGIVFQDFKLLGYLSVLDNVALAGEAAGLRKREARRRATRRLRIHEGCE